MIESNSRLKRLVVSYVPGPRRCFRCIHFSSRMYNDICTLRPLVYLRIILLILIFFRISSSSMFLIHIPPTLQQSFLLSYRTRFYIMLLT